MLKRIGTLLLAVAAISGCYFPSDFEADIQIDRQGRYRFTYVGKLTDLSMAQRMARGDLQGTAVLGRVEIAERDLRRDSAYGHDVSFGRLSRLTFDESTRSGEASAGVEGVDAGGHGRDRSSSRGTDAAKHKPRPGFVRVQAGGLQALRIPFEYFAGDPRHVSAQVDPDDLRPSVLELVVKAVEATRTYDVYKSPPIKVLLTYKGCNMAMMEVTSKFTPDKPLECIKVWRPRSPPTLLTALQLTQVTTLTPSAPVHLFLLTIIPAACDVHRRPLRCTGVWHGYH